MVRPSSRRSTTIAILLSASTAARALCLRRRSSPGLELAAVFASAQFVPDLTAHFTSAVRRSLGCHHGKAWRMLDGVRRSLQ